MTHIVETTQLDDLGSDYFAIVFTDERAGSQVVLAKDAIPADGRCLDDDLGGSDLWIRSRAGTTVAGKE
jgi:hypothetical protein